MEAYTLVTVTAHSQTFIMDWFVIFSELISLVYTLVLIMLLSLFTNPENWQLSVTSSTM